MTRFHNDFLLVFPSQFYLKIQILKTRTLNAAHARTLMYTLYTRHIREIEVLIFLKYKFHTMQTILPSPNVI